MPIQKDGKTYYSQEEMDERMEEFIEIRAQKVADEILKRNKEFAKQEHQYV